MVLQLEYASESPGVLLKNTAGPHPRFCFSGFGVVDENRHLKFLGDALGLGTALRRTNSVI